MYRSICVLSLFVLSAQALDTTAIMSTLMDVGVHVATAADQCFNHHGIKVPTLDKLSFDNIAQPAKCAMACVFTATGLMDDSGNFNGAALLKAAPAAFPGRDVIEQIIKDCSNKGGKDACEGAFNFVKCVGHEKILKSKLGAMASKGMKLINMVTR